VPQGWQPEWNVLDQNLHFETAQWLLNFKTTWIGQYPQHYNNGSMQGEHRTDIYPNYPGLGGFIEVKGNSSELIRTFQRSK
jgi:hypothetical protein